MEQGDDANQGADIIKALGDYARYFNMSPGSVLDSPWFHFTAFYTYMIEELENELKEREKYRKELKEIGRK